ncbi:hypothetical protein N0V85_003801 [Neurospora sp. IMI 360204]|nr:hypothetical protein N0V85_003801 [Neurospora sp. IMI 360204]
MPPINLHTHSPINAAKASDAKDPKTATPEAQSQSGTVPNANPDPQPTGTATLNQATPTYLASDRTPPPPQPGAVPSLPAQTGTGTATTTHLPPQPSSQYYPGGPAAPAPSGPITSPPHQMSIPPPTASYNYSQRGTSTTTGTVPPPPTRTLPTYLPGASPAELGLRSRPGAGSGFGSGGGGDLSHPPGYQQDAMASDMNQAQRAAHEYAASHGGHGHGHGGGGGGGGGDDDEGVWNSAKKWIQDAGAKVAEAESEVWKKINSQK